MKILLSFPSARKLCAALVAVLRVIESALAAFLWRIVAVRSRLADSLELAQLKTEERQ